jgi:hypothetical protein
MATHWTRQFDQLKKQIDAVEPQRTDAAEREKRQLWCDLETMKIDLSHVDSAEAKVRQNALTKL